MRILIYGINFSPELTGIGKYSGEMAAWFAERGHAVTVVTAPPYYPDWKVFAGATNAWSRSRHVDGADFEVWRSPIWVPRVVSGRNRMLHLLSFALSSAPALLTAVMVRRPQVIFVVAPTLVSLPSALLASRLWRCPAWLHVQDFEVDAMLGLGILKVPGRIRRLAFGIERWLMRRFDRVSSISEKMCERLQEKGVGAPRIALFPNWVDLAAIFPMEGRNAYRDEWQIEPGQTVVLYAGNLGDKQGIEVVIEAARALSSRPDVRFIIAGEGAAKNRLMELAKDLPLLRWLPLQPASRLNELLNAADIHVLPQRADAADLVMPSKLTGMLASGRATLGTAQLGTQLGTVLEKCGVRVAPGDSQAMSAAITKLADAPEMRRSLGLEGRRFAVNTMSRDAILSRAANDLEQLLRTRSSR